MPSRSVLLLITVAVATAIVLLVLRHPRVNALFHSGIPDRPKRRLFLAAVGFFVTFSVARTLAYVNYHQIGPFHDIYIHGRHIHHLVWGILILLGVGFGWLVELGCGSEHSSIIASRLMSFLYGAGAALTLDEFALWLNLEDVYWARQGRESIDAIILFGSLLLIAIWGADFSGRPRESSVGGSPQRCKYGKSGTRPDFHRNQQATETSLDLTSQQRLAPHRA
jgi:hypothetical protein